LIESARIDPRTFRITLIGSDDPVGASGSGDFDFLLRQGCLEWNNTWVPRDQAQRIVASADYLLLLDWTEGRVALQVPAKLFEYIRIGRPILACTIRDSPAERILVRSGIPHAILHPDAAPGDNEERLAAFLQRPPTVTEPSAWFQAQFNAEAQARALAEIIERMR
jgi:hypothetical protein